MSQYKPSKFFITALLTCIFAGSFLIRISYIKNTVIIKPIRADAQQYIIYGYNIARHGIFSKEFSKTTITPDSYRSPGYPLFVALSFIAGGDKNFYSFVLYSQAVIGAMIPILAFLTAMLFLPFTWSMAISLLAAFSPHLISISSYCLTETLFSFVLLSSILFFIYSIKYNYTFLFIISSLLCGYSYLTNETFLFIPYIFTGIIIYSYYKQNNFNKKFLINLVTFIIIFSLFPAVWILRNNIILKSDAQKGSSRAIHTMTHGSYPDFIYKSEKYKYFPYREDPKQPEFGSSLNAFTNILWQRIKERPFEYFIWYCFKKPYYLWTWNILQGQGDIYIYPVTQSLYSISKSADFTKTIMHLLHPVIIFFAFAGIPLFIVKHRYKARQSFYKNNTIPLIIFSIFIYYTFLYTVFAPWPRYAIPLRPVLYMCGIWTVVRLCSIKKKEKTA